MGDLNSSQLLCKEILTKNFSEIGSNVPITPLLTLILMISACCRAWEEAEWGWEQEAVGKCHPVW